MFPGSSPLKRKTVDQNNEDAMSDDDAPSCSTKRRRRSLHNDTNSIQVSKTIKQEQNLDRVREIILREFNQEMKLKEAQLDLVDDRLEEAKSLLERLRYALVAEYYKKQEHTQAMVDAEASMRVENAQSESKQQKQQVPLHPSLKKIIGKRPHNVSENMRVYPKRDTAKNSKNLFGTYPTAESLEERRFQKDIRERESVVEYSKETIKSDPNASKPTGDKVIGIKQNGKIECTSNPLEVSKPHVLNNTRTCNKLKCHFVVGNTSKYLGKYDDLSNNTSYTHKWLVYVQTKDSETPIEKYIKKVRFFLHTSYRPNDLVDILEPPFQVSRRGWGEFPMRIQLFFHNCYQQRPLQLIHNVVLDTTKSGRHTLGAETVVEVWLRNDTSKADKHVRPLARDEDVIPTNLEMSSATSTTAHLTPDINRKPRTISFNIKETFDDNFFDFLNKIEESRTSICADIEKIEPTLLVNEPLEPQFSNTFRSPNKKELSKSPFKITSTELSPIRNMSIRLTPQNIQTFRNHSTLASPPTLPNAIKNATNKLSAIINQSEIASNDLSDPKERSKLKALNQTGKISTNNINTIPTISSKPLLQTTTLTNTSSRAFTIASAMKANANTNSAAPGKVFNNASGTIILPLTKEQISSQQPKQNPNTQVHANFSNKAIFQKKTIQVINAQGQVKMVQMLVASPKNLPGVVVTNSTTSSAGIRVMTSKELNTQQTNTFSGSTEILNTNFLKQKAVTSKFEKKIPITSAPLDSVCTSASNSSPHHYNTKNAISAIKLPTKNCSKNVVFQKEGKLFIIDPLQMKLKQQRKNQVSLLKPQVKQQTPQKNLTLQSVASDHDYAPPPPLHLNSLQMQDNRNVPVIRTPQIHMGMRETRLSAIKAQDHQKLQRTQVERKFNNTEFSNMRSAVEYLLRRLPLIESDKESPAIAFPFVRGTSQEFQSLPAFKQRSFEWLRAKFIANFIRNCQSLQKLHASEVESFWSTREIATFARFHGFTPPIKALQQVEKMPSDIEAIPGSKEHLTALIKTEMKGDYLQLDYNTLSPVSYITHWIDNMEHQLETDHRQLFTEELIIIDEGEECNIEKTTSKNKTNSEAAVTSQINDSPLIFENNKISLSYLPTPERLETTFQYVGDVCKDICVRFSPEEIIPGVVHSSAQTALAHVAQLFIERLLRQAIANQTLNEQEKHNSCLPHNNLERYVTSQDIRKVISESDEFDFLTNRYMGVKSQRIKND